MGESELLRDLHAAYTWEVNAAVGEGRMDLVWRLADEYMVEALQLMSAMESPGCGRPDCVICARHSSAPTLPPGRPRRRRVKEHVARAAHLGRHRGA